MSADTSELRVLESPRREQLEYALEMAWSKPEYTKSEVNRAGDIFRTHEDALTADLTSALDVINNWRSSHSFPLNTFQNDLRHKAIRIDTKSLISQRIKRLAAIQLKLRLQPTMTLSQMQDIGGCRAVVRTVRGVYRLVDLFTKSRFHHTLRRTTDYVKTPRTSGYRSVHLLYNYQGRVAVYNGLQIEVQIRSQLQHAWATAVETVGTFLRQALKSSQGEGAWLRFFALMGSAMATMERTALVPGTPETKKELIAELRGVASELQVNSKLTAYGTALRMMSSRKGLREAKYFLLELDAAEKELQVTGYGSDQLPLATKDYLKKEEAIVGRPGAETVLVSVGSVSALRRAYPSYFLDTRRFLQAVKDAINQ